MTYVCRLEISGRELPLKIAGAYKTRFYAPLEIFQGAHRSAICRQLLTFRVYMILLIYLILPAAQCSNQPLTEMSTRNLPGGAGKEWPARKADNITAI
jgi:hypothetical protein